MRSFGLTDSGERSGGPKEMAVCVPGALPPLLASSKDLQPPPARPENRGTVKMFVSKSGRPRTLGFRGAGAARRGPPTPTAPAPRPSPSSGCSRARAGAGAGRAGRLRFPGARPEARPSRPGAASSHGRGARAPSHPTIIGLGQSILCQRRDHGSRPEVTRSWESAPRNEGRAPGPG